MPNKSDYYIRVGRFTHERKVLEEYTDCYYGLNIPANIFAYYKKSFLALINKIRCPFFVDPQTYIFASISSIDIMTRKIEIKENDIKREERVLKKSYEKLLGYYEDADNLKQILKDGPISPSYFNDNNLKKFINSSLDFQQNVLLKESEESSISKYDEIYRELQGDKSNEQEDILQPNFLIMPYFYFENISSPWYEINLKILKITKKLSASLEKYAVICFDKTLLNNNESLNQIINDFNGFDGYIVFISRFNEWASSKEELEHFKDFIDRLYVKYKKPIIHSYATIFSGFLNQFGLSGFSSGIYINNFKDISQGGAGRIKFRFYLPSLHAILTESESKLYFVDFDLTEECSGDLCKHVQGQKSNVISSDRAIIDRLFSNDESLKFITRESSKHLLINMKKEIEFINKNNITAYITKLNQDINFSNRYQRIKSNHHLGMWVDVLSNQ